MRRRLPDGRAALFERREVGVALGGVAWNVRLESDPGNPATGAPLIVVLALLARRTSCSRRRGPGGSTRSRTRWRRRSPCSGRRPPEPDRPVSRPASGRATSVELSYLDHQRGHRPCSLPFACTSPRRIERGVAVRELASLAVRAREPAGAGQRDEELSEPRLVRADLPARLEADRRTRAPRRLALGERGGRCAGHAVRPRADRLGGQRDAGERAPSAALPAARAGRALERAVELVGHPAAVEASRLPAHALAVERALDPLRVEGDRVADRLERGRRRRGRTTPARSALRSPTTTST